MSLKSILLPDLGEGVTEGEIVKIKVKEGERITLDQVLLEVMTDKASMEVPSSIEGLLKKTAVKEGDIVPVGAELFLIEADGSAEAGSSKNQKDSRRNLEKTGGEAEVQSKKEDSSKESNLSPSVLKPPQEEPSFKNLKTDPKKDSQAKTPATIPATRRLAGELGIDLNQVFQNQTKVERKELLNYIKSQLETETKGFSPKKPPSQDREDFKETKRIPLKGLKRLMFESMAYSKTTIPHFTLGEEARADHLIQLRLEMKNRLEKQGLKVGFLPFFIKALIPTLQEFPLFNSFYDSQTKEIVFKENLNIGFAVDSPQGLMVPVIKQVQNKSLLEIIKEVYEKAKQAREGSITREDLLGAGLTLTNLGGIGGIYGTPIIPAPEMAILGIYKIFQKVIKTEQGFFEEKNFMNFSITCDHRFIDGATAVRFLKSFIKKIEEPSLLLL